MGFWRNAFLGSMPDIRDDLEDDLDIWSLLDFIRESVAYSFMACGVRYDVGVFCFCDPSDMLPRLKGEQRCKVCVSYNKFAFFFSQNQQSL